MKIHRRVRRASVTLGLLLILVVGPGGPGVAAEPKGSIAVEAARISVQLRNADIRDALRMIAKQANVDIVMSRKVTGTITLDLSDASIAETLDAIMKVSGFRYAIEDNIITVSTLEELVTTRDQQKKLYEASHPEPLIAATEVRVFQLEYVAAERMKSAVEMILSPVGKVSLMKTADQVARDTRAPAAAGGTDLAIGSRLPSSSLGQPAASHTLVVVDVPKHLERVARVVAQLDVRPIQLLIQTRIIEITLNDDQKLGIDWNVVASGSGAAVPHTFPFGETKLGSFDPRVTGNPTSGVFPNAPNSSALPDAPGLFTFGTLDFTSFSYVLRMIEQNSRVQLVSNPRILVRDRNTATILVGERYPILSTTISDQGTVTEELDRYEPIGVQLQVTPSVLGNNEVSLIVRPSISALGAVVRGSTGIEVVRINTRQIDTSVTVQDGQTVVLGGLVSTRESETVSKVPLLSEIPLLGDLFTHTSQSSEKVDLVIFLTVTILKENGLTEAERKMFEKTDPKAGESRAAGTERSPLEFRPSLPRY